MKKKTLLSVAVTVVLMVALVPWQSYGATSAPIEVNATVLAGCDVFADPVLFFPGYDPVNNTGDSSTMALLSVNCTAGTQYTLDIIGADGGGGLRMMRDVTGNELRYSLQSAETGDWPNSYLHTSVAIGDYELFTLSATIMPGQLVPAGTYTDSLAVNVTY